MALLPENVLVLYRDGNADSLDFANYYAALHKLSPSQLIPVPCSGDEILSSYADFQTEIENAVLSALSDPYVAASTKAIVVGYGVPGGFRDTDPYTGEAVIATTSRLSRVNFTFTRQSYNPLFNRKVYKDYDSTDAQQVLIASRIDAPSLALAKNIVDNFKKVIRQSNVNGSFYFDSDAITNEYVDALNYFSELDFFENNLLPILNMNVVKTYHWDEYTDVPTFRLNNDSFMWGWQSDRAGYTLFKDTNVSRFFLYNADNDGAYTVRDSDERRWPWLALASGYAATAGAMSDPTTDGYLIPAPFFDALYRGATIGEAFLLAVPFVDWTLGMFGDPLVKVKFHGSSAFSDLYSLSAGFEIMKNNLANAISYSDARQDAFTDAVYTIVLSDDLSTSIDLFYKIYDVSANPLISSASFKDLGNALINLPTDINTTLADNSFQISSRISEVTENTVIDSVYYYDVGSWVFDDTIQHVSGFSLYHFEIDLSLYEDFSVIFHNANSWSDQTNWKYEKSSLNFYAVPANGVMSSYAGLRVRYLYPILLNRHDVFYARIRQRDMLRIATIAEYTDYRIFKQVVSS